MAAFVVRLSTNLPLKDASDASTFETPKRSDLNLQSIVCFSFVTWCFLNIKSFLFYLLYLFRSSHQMCSVTKGVPRNFAKFTGKHLCQSLFFNKVAGLRPAILLKKRLWHRCFPVNFAKFLRTPFLQNTSGRLLLFIFLECLAPFCSKCESENSTCLKCMEPMILDKVLQRCTTCPVLTDYDFRTKRCVPLGKLCTIFDWTLVCLATCI